MKAMVWGSVMFVLAGRAGDAHGADPAAVEQPAAKCAYRAEPSTTAGPIAKSALTSIAVEPAADGNVRRDTMIAFDVEYRIKDFVANQFFLMPLFRTAGDTSAAPGGPSDYPYLTAAAGKVHLCVPLGEMYDTPAMEWPLAIALSLMQMRPDGSSRVMTFLPNVKFNALDIPAGAMAGQADRPPIDYYDNLKKTWEFFETRLARYKACNQRFPKEQAAMIKAYRSWETRHSDTVKFVSELQFDYYLLSARGDVARATNVFDGIRGATLNAHMEMPAEILRQQCDIALSEFSDSEDLTDNIIEDEVAYLRKWHATHGKATL